MENILEFENILIAGYHRDNSEGREITPHSRRQKEGRVGEETIKYFLNMDCCFGRAPRSG